jgi:tRNA dimethylallyltransferase
VGLRWDKEALSRRINARVKAMIQQGLVEEVDRIRKQPGGFSEEAGAAVGYRQLLDYFAGKCTLDEAVEQIKIQTRYLAKMQRTWLKRWPPAGQVHWLDMTDTSAPEELINAVLQVIHAA